MIVRSTSLTCNPLWFCTFRGNACYKTKQGSAVFGCTDHTKRLIDSCKIYRMEPELQQEDFNEAILETIRVNRMKECYIRPIVYRGYHSLGVNPFPCPIDSAILVWEWGKYLGARSTGKGSGCLRFLLEPDAARILFRRWQKPAPIT